MAGAFVTEVRKYAVWDEMCPMSFTVYGEHPNVVGHSEFDRASALGAVFKAAEMMGDGWESVHISDHENKIFWPEQFDQLYVMDRPGV
jgi:hypothetical protein